MKKTVVITGATDGIGYELALLLVKDYNLAICGRDRNKMEVLLEMLYNSSTTPADSTADNTFQSNDINIYHDCFDITDDNSRNNFCEQVLNRFGSADILVNNAGANVKKDRVVDIDLFQLRYMFELNCISALGMIQKLYPRMSQRKSGLIVNILSSCCLFNNPLTGAYSASKDAMEGISKILLKEVKDENIGVCNVYPGGVDTSFRLVPNHQYLKPVTVAKMIKNCIENEDGCVHEIVLRPFIEDNIC